MMPSKLQVSSWNIMLFLIVYKLQKASNHATPSFPFSEFLFMWCLYFKKPSQIDWYAFGSMLVQASTPCQTFLLKSTMKQNMTQSFLFLAVENTINIINNSMILKHPFSIQLNLARKYVFNYFPTKKLHILWNFCLPYNIESSNHSLFEPTSLDNYDCCFSILIQIFDNKYFILFFLPFK